MSAEKADGRFDLMFDVLALARQFFRRHGDGDEEQSDERPRDGGTSGEEFVEILGDHSPKLLRSGRTTARTRPSTKRAVGDEPGT